ncbi:hypothetical protein [Alteromonas sp. CYL-A6]|uniref:hypothetical protein n=1 Tax=Alteromonas nitratireducens TaxID=3390813 RepID=UPI0034B9C8C4
MKASSLILLSTLALGTVSTQVNAQESALENLLGKLVSQAVAMTTAELENNARTLVANTSHMFELESSTVATRVSVTDIVAEKNEEDETDAGE